MIIFKLLIILLFIVIYFYLKRFLKFHRNKKGSRDKKFLTFNKGNFNRWMNLSKKERYNLTKKESITYLNKRKVLLEEIRKEYKKISKDNS